MFVYSVGELFACDERRYCIQSVYKEPPNNHTNKSTNCSFNNKNADNILAKQKTAELFLANQRENIFIKSKNVNFSFLLE